VLELFWHKSGLVRLWMTFEAILHFIKTLCLYNVDILDLKKERFGVKRMIYNIAEKDGFEILR
jgi:hypothetical protein